MFCPKCATQNIDGASFCRACGANISLIPQALSGQLPQVTEESDRHSRRLRRGLRAGQLVGFEPVLEWVRVTEFPALPTRSNCHFTWENEIHARRYHELLKDASLYHTVELIWFNGEEQGLWGSRHQGAQLGQTPIVAMLNLDMVGRVRDEKLSIGGTGTAASFDKLVDEAARGSELKILKGDEKLRTQAADTSDDFDKEDPQVYFSSPATLKFNPTEWAMRLRKLSAEFSKYPGALDTSVQFETRTVTQTLVTTDGTRLEFGRPFFMPPNVPAARVAAVRRAFDATMKDKAFIDEADKLKIEVDPLSGEQVAALVEQLYRTPPATVARVRAAMEHR